MAIIFPSNFEYLGSKPNFTRDSFDTLEAMEFALASGHIDEGHLSYCKETGATYRATVGETGELVWKDMIGGLKIELESAIREKETVILETLRDLAERLSQVEKEITYVEGDPGILGLQTRLDDVWEWYDKMTHTPVVSSRIEKIDTGKLRGGTNHTYKVTFQWDWAARAGIDELQINDGTGWSTVTLTGDLEAQGGSQEATMRVSLGQTPMTLGARFVCDGEVYSAGGSEVVVTPLPEIREFIATGLPDTWTMYSEGLDFDITVTATGKDLSSYSAGDVVRVNGETLGTMLVVTDNDYVVTDSKTVTVDTISPYHYTWDKANGATIISKDYGMAPSFLISMDSWDKTSEGLAGFRTKYVLFQEGEVDTITPMISGPTVVFLSPIDNRMASVMSIPASSPDSEWVENTGFTESGTVEYLGETYYYVMNPDLGEGRFKFKFTL